MKINPNTCIYVIGDIHGEYNLLFPLLQYIDSDNAMDKAIIFLGDLINRGPNSCQVVEIVKQYMKKYPKSKLIKGNHDKYFLAVLGTPSEEENLIGDAPIDAEVNFMDHGGLETILSYGAYSVVSLRDKLFNEYKSHLKLYSKAKDWYSCRGHVFVHAGIDRDKPLSKQDRNQVQWIRDGFLDNETIDGKIVVHGHTITNSHLPEIYPNRIALDTGSYKTKVLTLMKMCPIEGGYSFIQSTPNGITPIVAVNLTDSLVDLNQYRDQLIPTQHVM